MKPKAERVAFVRLQLAGFKTLAEAEAAAVAKFGITHRAARRAVTAACEQMSGDVVDREHQRAKIRDALHAVVADAIAKGDHRVVLQALEALVALDGLGEATRVAIEHGYVVDAPVLGKTALAERLAELEARAKSEAKGDGKGN